MLAWDEANQLRYGSASAYSVVLFLFVALVAFTFVKILGADVIGSDEQSDKPQRTPRKARR